MKYPIYLITACFLLLSIPPLSPGGDDLTIRRVRIIPNPWPEAIESQEVLELTFRTVSRGWVGPLGWTVRAYDRERNPTGTTVTAFFPRDLNPTYRIKGNIFKGNTTYISYFKLPSIHDFIVAALGQERKIKARLWPATCLLQDFSIPRSEVEDDFSRSRTRILPER